jgi:hypothetical protein
VFKFENGPKQGDAFNFVLEYAIMKVQEYQMGLKLNGAHQLLAYADEGNLLGNNVDNVKKTQEL